LITEEIAVTIKLASLKKKPTPGIKCRYSASPSGSTGLPSGFFLFPVVSHAELVVLQVKKRVKARGIRRRLRRVEPALTTPRFALIAESVRA
jgi:hypothetical protein